MVTIDTFGNKLIKEFEGTTDQLKDLAQEYLAYVITQMFSEKGDYYFQRDMNIQLFIKDPLQQWKDANVIDIFDPKQDLELHLMAWEEEAMLIPDLPQMNLKYDSLRYIVLSQNMQLYNVVGELKDA